MKFIKKNKYLNAVFSRQSILFWVIVISVLLRIGSAIFMGNQVIDLPGTADQISYHNLALRVLGGNGFSFDKQWWPITPADAPTAHWSFLYTLYLVIVYYLFGPFPLVARIIQAIITGILHPYLAYRIGDHLFSKKVGLISAALTAVYAYFFYYDATLMTEPFFITLVMACLYLSILLGQEFSDYKGVGSFNRRNILLSALLGLTLGGAVLLRQLVLLFLPFLYLWIGWVSRKYNIKAAFTSIILSSIIIILMILPFTIYNVNRFGHFVLLNTNSGYAFFWANHPIYGTNFQPILTDASYQDLIPSELRNLDEAELDQALLRRGLQFILDDPIRYFLLSLSRIPVYFMFWPTPESGTISNISRVVSFGLLWPFMLYGVLRALFASKISLIDRLSTPMFLLICFSVIYSAIHILSWTLIRYRLPVDGVMLVFAGYAFLDIFEKVINWRKSRVKIYMPK